MNSVIRSPLVGARCVRVHEFTAVQPRGGEFCETLRSRHYAMPPVVSYIPWLLPARCLPACLRVNWAKPYSTIFGPLHAYSYYQPINSIISRNKKNKAAANSFCRRILGFLIKHRFLLLRIKSKTSQFGFEGLLMNFVLR